MAILTTDHFSCGKRNPTSRLFKASKTQLAVQVFLCFMLSVSIVSVPLAMKLLGVHWQMLACSPQPRIAEVTAGLVQTSLNLNAESAARADAFGYQAIWDMVADVKTATGREVILHFTAVEMDNDPACGNGNSMAEALVFWLSHGAQDRGITHQAENALACVDQPGDDRTWASIRNGFTHTPYSGLSLLRLVSSGCNPCATEKGRYQEFIQDFVGAAKPDLVVHLAEWASCIEPACRFNVHTFASESGTFAMQYEGLINGRHWWIGTVPRQPTFFSSPSITRTVGKVRRARLIEPTDAAVMVTTSSHWAGPIQRHGRRDLEWRPDIGRLTAHAANHQSV